MQKYNNFLITSTLLTSENVHYDYDFISYTLLVARFIQWSFFFVHVSNVNIIQPRYMKNVEWRKFFFFLKIYFRKCTTHTRHTEFRFRLNFISFCCQTFSRSLDGYMNGLTLWNFLIFCLSIQQISWNEFFSPRRVQISCANSCYMRYVRSDDDAAVCVVSSQSQTRCLHKFSYCRIDSIYENYSLLSAVDWYLGYVCS